MELVDVDPTAPDDAALVSEALDRVLLPAFSRDELPDGASIAQSARASERFCLTVATEDGAVVGAAVSSVVAGDIGLLDYLATRSERRSHGVGSALVRHQEARWAEWGTVVLAEVHDPDADPAGTDDEAVRRLRFYGRLGARMLETPWIQPRLTAGTARVPGMLLLLLAPRTVESVDGAALAEWTRAYFRDSEGAVDDGDTELRALIDQMTRHERIGSRDVRGS